MKTITDEQIKEASLNAEYPLQFIEGCEWYRDQMDQLNLVKECENCLFLHVSNNNYQCTECDEYYDKWQPQPPKTKEP